jgi:membrane peptidoglycan carboxypeptidase
MVGYTPSLSTAVWMGTDKRLPIRTASGSIIYGSGLPGDIWQQFMNTVLEGTPEEDLPDAPLIKGDTGEGVPEPAPKPTRTATPTPTRTATPTPTRTETPPSSPKPPADTGEEEPAPEEEPEETESPAPSSTPKPTVPVVPPQDGTTAPTPPGQGNG